MTPHEDDARYYPEWLQAEPDDFWDRQRFRARVWRWVVAGLAMFWLCLAAWALVSCGILP